MPRLVKGAKWVFGWVTVGPDRVVSVPPEAWEEYGFRAGEEAIFMRGSRRSGGFAIGTTRLMVKAAERLDGGMLRVLGKGRFLDGGRVAVPACVKVEVGDRLLTARGSCYGLGFVAQGPIYEEALKHPELACFGG